MLVLPSVGATVKKILLNESATKAKIFYDDGSTTIVSTNNTPTKSSVKKISVSPSGTTVVKKKIVKKKLSESMGMPSFRTVKTTLGNINVPTSTHIKSISDPDVANIVERAKRRAAMLESKTMDGSQKFAMNTQDGTKIDLAQST